MQTLKIRSQVTGQSPRNFWLGWLSTGYGHQQGLDILDLELIYDKNLNRTPIGPMLEQTHSKEIMNFYHQEGITNFVLPARGLWWVAAGLVMTSWLSDECKGVAFQRQIICFLR